MRAIAIDRFGGPEVLVARDVEAAQPGEGEVRLRLAFAGVNYIDVYMRTGAYARSHTYETPLPMVPGMEGAGTVEAVGPGVEGFAVGQRAAWCIVRGAYAQSAVVPAWRLVPDAASHRAGAAARRRMIATRARHAGVVGESHPSFAKPSRARSRLGGSGGATCLSLSPKR